MTVEPVNVQSWMHKASGYVCPSPVIYEFEGEMRQRDCGHCARCQARKKRDVAGRAAAEACLAAEVNVWTLTYGTLEPFPKDGRAWVQDVSPEAVAGAKDFVTKHRQDFLKRYRDALWQEARRLVGAPRQLHRVTVKRGERFHHQDAHIVAYWRWRIDAVLPRVRYLGCGERGKRRTQRCHWHLCLFLSKTSGFRATPLERKPDGSTRPGHETHALWPHGFVNIDVLNGDDALRAKLPEPGVDHVSWSADRFGKSGGFNGAIEPKMKAARYAIKYLTKANQLSRRARRAGEPDEAKFFRSTATPLGFEFLTDVARETARAALPVRGDYRVPGVYFSRPRQGRYVLSRFVIQGRMREHFLEAYRAEWMALRPDQEIPRTPWRDRFDPEGEWRAARRGWGQLAFKERRQARPAVATAKPDRSAVIPVSVRGQGGLGVVQVFRSGRAVWIDREGVQWPIPRGHLRDLVRMDEAAHREIEAKIAMARGPDWLDPREYKLRKLQRQLAQRDAVLRFAQEGPAIGPAHLPGHRPMTALRRKLLINGTGHIPGTVVVDPRSNDPAPFVRDVTGLRRPIYEREP
jgi:hypothetical protein